MTEVAEIDWVIAGTIIAITAGLAVLCLISVFRAKDVPEERETSKFEEHDHSH